MINIFTYLFFLQDVLKHITRYKLPGTVAGSPSWFRDKLADLLAVVDNDTLPGLFLTLTADEHSPTRWPEMDALESVLHEINPALTWQDAPVEAARIFVDRVNAFMQKYVVCDCLEGREPGTGGIYGHVYRYMIRYEVQGRHSLHAHIMLWLSKTDRTTTGDDISACNPNIWDSERSCWVVPDEYANSEAHSVQSQHIPAKQQHKCTDVGEPGCRYKGPCK